MKLPTLYKKNKDGSLQSWTIYTEDNQIITEHGKVDGKMQKSTKLVKSKNLGKKNETTAEQQAESTAQSMWTKKKDKGYFETAERAKTKVVFLPMLAHDMKKMNEKQIKNLLNKKLFIQPKLDGIRCLARWQNNKIQLLSRGGKEYNIPHLEKELEAILNPGQVLDGEIYIHGLLRQDINALVKKHRDDEYNNTGYCSNDLGYWIYDTFCVDDLDRPFKERLEDLNQINESKFIKQVETTALFVKSPDPQTRLRNYHEAYIQAGFEGTIIRIADGVYNLAHRSRDLIKYKDFQDEEFNVVDFTEGEGKFVGCVIWICETTDSKKFNVVPKGSLKQKQEWFKKAKEYIGKKLTVKFQSYSKDGIPEFPVGIDFRLEEDM